MVAASVDVHTSALPLRQAPKKYAAAGWKPDCSSAGSPCLKQALVQLVPSQPANGCASCKKQGCRHVVVAVTLTLAQLAGSDCGGHAKGHAGTHAGCAHVVPADAAQVAQVAFEPVAAHAKAPSSDVPQPLQLGAGDAPQANRQSSAGKPVGDSDKSFWVSFRSARSESRGTSASGSVPFR